MLRMDQETVWLTLNQMAMLIQRDKSVIYGHIRNVFDECELPRERDVARFAAVLKEGDREVSREVEYFNLNVIISMGYRVKSHIGTQFRIWATQRLQEYIVKGFVLDDERRKHCGGRNTARFVGGGGRLGIMIFTSTAIHPICFWVDK